MILQGRHAHQTRREQPRTPTRPISSGSRLPCQKTCSPLLTSRLRTGANRSEAIRDLMRAALVKDELRTPTAQVIGSLTMIYDHHTGDLTRQLDEIQHDYTAEIVSTMHVHLDHHNCLEILAVRGQGARVYELADKLLGLRGVHHGELTCAATGASLER